MDEQIPLQYDEDIVRYEFSPREVYLWHLGYWLLVAFAVLIIGLACVLAAW